MSTIMTQKEETIDEGFENNDLLDVLSTPVAAKEDTPTTPMAPKEDTPVANKEDNNEKNNDLFDVLSTPIAQNEDNMA